MTQTEIFVCRLETMGVGELAQLRVLAGSSLDESLPGFDQFTGLWWPLRQRSQRTPPREASWLLAKLFSWHKIAQVDGDDASLPRILGRCEPINRPDQRRHLQRIDALLCAQLSALEPHLRWALSVAARETKHGRAPGVNWVRLLDDLSAWERGADRHGEHGVRNLWVMEYMRGRSENRR